MVVGALLILAAASARADDPPGEPIPTVVRKGNFEVIPCTGSEVCEAGSFMFDRTSLDRMITIAKSEEDCRRGELKRLDEPEGWDPLSVVLVAGGVVVVMGGVAFLAGYLVGAK